MRWRRSRFESELETLVDECIPVGSGKIGIAKAISDVESDLGEFDVSRCNQGADDSIMERQSLGLLLLMSPGFISLFGYLWKQRGCWWRFGYYGRNAILLVPTPRSTGVIRVRVGLNDGTFQRNHERLFGPARSPGKFSAIGFSWTYTQDWTTLQLVAECLY